MLGQVWSEGTWATRTSQWKKFVIFCEADGRPSFPADEGAVLAFIGYLRQEGRISAQSLPHYVSAVARYHTLAGLPSPTSSPLVKALMAAYSRATVPDVPEPVRIGVSAAVVRKILRYGLAASDPTVVRDAALCVTGFLTGSRGSSVGAMELSDYGVSEAGVLSLRLVHRKGRNARDPLVLAYPPPPNGVPGEEPQDLLARWVTMRPMLDCMWKLQEHDCVNAEAVTQALVRVLRAVNVEPPNGCVYSSHSLRIGCYNELRALGLPEARIMHHLGWASQSMGSVYYDPRIQVTDDSEFFFGHLRGT